MAVFDSLGSSLTRPLCAKPLSLIRKNIDGCKKSVNNVESIFYILLGWHMHLVKSGVPRYLSSCRRSACGLARKPC